MCRLCVLLPRRVLAPGESLSADEQSLLDRICEAYYLPAWCSVADYEQLFKANGLTGIACPCSSSWLVVDVLRASASLLVVLHTLAWFESIAAHYTAVWQHRWPVQRLHAMPSRVSVCLSPCWLLSSMPSHACSLTLPCAPCPSSRCEDNRLVGRGGSLLG